MLGQTLCRTPEQFKAWSQNLGHEGVLTTFKSYGQLGAERQGAITAELRTGAAPAATQDPIEGLRALLRNQT
jgi:hypothetical protein